PIQIYANTQISFVSTTEITLKTSFTASPTGSGFFDAKIDAQTPRAALIDPMQTDAEHIVHVNKWEKLEIGLTLPQEYQDAIGAMGVGGFFDHYYDAIPNNIDPDNDLNPYADDSLLMEIHFTSP